MEKTYGGHTVAALREFLQHGDDTGETIDELTGDESSSANIIRDLLAAIHSDAAQAPIYQYRMVSGEWIDFPEQDGRMHIERGHTVRIVYAAPVAPQAARDAGQAPVAWQVRRADGRIDGAPIQWENCTQELYEATLTTGRYAGYENGPRCEVRALCAAPVAPAAVAPSEEIERLRALAKEYDACIRHMDAGGDFREFMASVNQGAAQ